MIHWIRFKWFLWTTCWRAVGHIPQPLYTRARELMTRLDARPESGEWKRHQVYARLIKEFPDVSHTTIAFVIEVVKCGL